MKISSPLVVCIVTNPAFAESFWTSSALQGFRSKTRVARSGLCRASIIQPLLVAAQDSVLKNNEGTTQLEGQEIAFDDGEDWLQDLTNLLLDDENNPRWSSTEPMITDEIIAKVLSGQAKRCSPESAAIAENILNRLERETEASHDKFQLRQEHYSMVMDAWAASEDPEAGVRADSILERLRELASTNPAFDPNWHTLNAAMRAWSCIGDVEKAEDILDKMEEASSIHLRKEDYLTLLTLYGRTGEAERAETLLNRMEHAGVGPDVECYNLVLEAWTGSTSAEAGKRAEAILDTMEQNCDVEKHFLLPNSRSYRLVITTWKNSNIDAAGPQAERVLQRMENFTAKHPEINVKPDAYFLTEVMDCFAKAGSASKAVEMFESMLKSSQEGNAASKPTTVTVNIVLDALAKSREAGAAGRAEEFLRAILLRKKEPLFADIHLDSISYTTVIDAYAKSDLPDAGERAEEIFRLMQAEAANGDPEAIPSTPTYNALMNAWVQSGCPGCEARAESILLQMEEGYGRGEIKDRPGVVSYSIVMNGWSKSRCQDALTRTQRVFERMVQSYKSGNADARPNSFSYVSLLNALCRRPSPDTAQLADRVIRQMYDEYKNGNEACMPNTQAITLVIDTWGKSGAIDAGENAESLLDWMIEIASQENDVNLQPNQISFSAAINAWAKARKFGKAKKAGCVLQKMKRAYEGGIQSAKPNLFAYTGLLNACAYAVGDAVEKSEAWKIATCAFKELCDSDFGRPNDVCYGVYVTACRNLLPEGVARASSIIAIFKRCCADGQVSNFVLQRVQSALTKEHFSKIMERYSVEGKISLSSIPNEWKRNTAPNDEKFRSAN